MERVPLPEMRAVQPISAPQGRRGIRTIHFEIELPDLGLPGNRVGKSLFV
jgi:hypothetical protein